MKVAQKFFFDENYPPSITKLLKDCLSYHVSKPEISHVIEIYGAGLKDDELIKRLIESGSKFIIISSDRGRSNNGPKLPVLCREANITHILLSGNLTNSKAFEKLRAIISKWPEIAEIDASKYSRYMLKYTVARKKTFFALSQIA